MSFLEFRPEEEDERKRIRVERHNEKFVPSKYTSSLKYMCMRGFFGKCTWVFLEWELISRGVKDNFLFSFTDPRCKCVYPLFVSKDTK